MQKISSPNSDMNMLELFDFSKLSFDALDRLYKTDLGLSEPFWTIRFKTVSFWEKRHVARILDSEAVNNWPSDLVLGWFLQHSDSKKHN